MWALLDPASLETVASLFLQTNLSKANVLDVLTERGAGKYYAFSRLSTFLTVRNALLGGGGGGGAGGAVGEVGGRGRWGNATETIVKGRTVLSWMDELATAWQDLPVLGVGIADYGPGTAGREEREEEGERGGIREIVEPLV